jgi:hypothetical protein
MKRLKDSNPKQPLFIIAYLTKSTNDEKSLYHFGILMM